MMKGSDDQKREGVRGRKQEGYGNMLFQLSRLVWFLLSYFLFFSFKTYTVQDRFPRGFTLANFLTVIPDTEIF